MENDVLAYIINEESTKGHKPTILDSSNQKFVVFETILQDFVTNRNSRLYTDDIIRSGLETELVKEEIAAGTWYGETGHPITDNPRRQFAIDEKRVSHAILNWKIQEGLLYGTVTTTAHPLGKVLAEEIRRGAKPAFSMRGMAPIVREGKIIRVKKPLKILCYDKVIFPSHKKAYMKRILTEDAYSSKETFKKLKEGGELVPLTEKTFVDILSESSNLNRVSDSLEFPYKKAIVEFSRELTHVTDPNTGMKIAINLEENIKNKLMNTYRDYILRR